MEQLLKRDGNSCLVSPLNIGALNQELLVPRCPDKSITHRALILASMASGRSEILNPLDSADCLATKRALEQLGVAVKESRTPEGATVWIIDSQGWSSWRSPNSSVDLGNSGTSARLLTGVLSGVPGLRVIIKGDHSLEKRPMGRVVEPLRSMGAIVESSKGAQDGHSLPLTITGQSLLSRSHYVETPSAQVKSALILAGLTAAGETTVDLPSGTRDHTERMLLALGANIRRRTFSGREVISVVGPWVPSPFLCDVPNDPSSVAFFAALAAIHPGLKVTAHDVLSNTTRTGFFTALTKLGVNVEWFNVKSGPRCLGEFRGSVTFYRPEQSSLQPIELDAEDVKALIDEVPILAVVCSVSGGTSKIHGLGELRVKESDRLAAIKDLLTRSGVECRVHDETLEIVGLGNPTAFSFSSEDHRLVMAAIILATRGDKSSNIEGINWIGTSFPLFLESFQNIKLDK